MAHFPAVTDTDGVMSAADKAKLDGFGAAGDYIKKDGTVAFTGDQSHAGFKITSVGAPVSGTDAANKAYVDALLAGLAWKDHVRMATTANITLSGVQTIDGVVGSAGERTLVKDQTLPKENGLYLQAAGAWTRTTDADTAIELESAAVFIDEGTVNANNAYVQTADNFTLGTDPVTWVKMFSGTAASDELDTTRWVGIGKIVATTDLDGAWIAPRAGTITRLTLHRRVAGSGSSTTVDVNKNSTTVFTTQANRPSVLFSAGADATDAHTNMDVTSFAQGDRITVDVDVAEGGTPKDLDVTMEVKYT